MKTPVDLLAAISLTAILIPAVSSSDSTGDPCIDSPSSCGHLSRITYPFRLTTDPPFCGNPLYELKCENDVPTISFNSTWFLVRAINYNNYTLNLSYLSFTSLCNTSSFVFTKYLNFHIYSSRYLNLPGESQVRSRQLYWAFTVFSCPVPLTDGSCKRYTGPRICRNSLHKALSSNDDNPYWYVACEGSFQVGELKDSCRVEFNLISSYQCPAVKSNETLGSEIVDYGIQLSWLLDACMTQGNPCLYLDNRFTEQYLQKSFYHSNSNWDGIIILIRYFLFIFVARVSLLSCIMLPILGFLVVRKWRRRHLSVYDNIEEFLQGFDEITLVRYSYSDVKRITYNFKEKLGEVGYGSVYKGKLRSGNYAAVKMLRKIKEGNGDEFISEVAAIGRARHVNIVRLMGFCVERSKRGLVYEYMAKGSLEKYIQTEHCDDISDRQMYDIALGIARGIEYLHRGCQTQILHFDIKPHNVHLNEKLIPKISDFGLAKMNTTDKSMLALSTARGTLGYMAPEFFNGNGGGISYKADVYSYGRMLIEMAARKRNSSAFSHSSQILFPS